MKRIMFIIVMIFSMLIINGQDGVWCWFSDPRSVNYNGVEFYGGVKENGCIGVYNDNGEEWDLGMVERDDHCNPSFLVYKNKLYCFYTRHYQKQFWMAEYLTWSKEWKVKEINLGLDNVTYSMPGIFKDSMMVVFRGNKRSLRMKYNNSLYVMKSGDGKKWSKPELIIDAIYCKINYDNDRIHFIINDAHPVSLPNNSTYYCYYEDGKFYKSGGEEIKRKLPLVPKESMELIWDGNKENSWLWDIKIFNGKPYLAFATFGNIKNQKYWISKLTDDGGWITEHVANGGRPLYASQEFYSGGIILIDPLSYAYSNNNDIHLVKLKDNYHTIVGEGFRPYYNNGWLYWVGGKYINYVNYKTKIYKYRVR